MDYNPDETHQALIDQLKKHPALKRWRIEPQIWRNSGNWHKMDTNLINHGVSLLGAYWNLSGGSIGNLDLYELLQVYMRSDKARDEINKVVSSRLKEVRGI